MGGFVTASRAGGTGSPLPACPGSVAPPHPTPDVDASRCRQLPSSPLRVVVRLALRPGPSWRKAKPLGARASRLAAACGEAARSCPSEVAVARGRRTGTLHHLRALGLL